MFWWKKITENLTKKVMKYTWGLFRINMDKIFYSEKKINIIVKSTDPSHYSKSKSIKNY